MSNFRKIVSQYLIQFLSQSLRKMKILLNLLFQMKNCFRRRNNVLRVVKNSETWINPIKRPKCRTTSAIWMSSLSRLIPHWQRSGNSKTFNQNRKSKRNSKRDFKKKSKINIQIYMMFWVRRAVRNASLTTFPNQMCKRKMEETLWWKSSLLFKRWDKSHKLGNSKMGRMVPSRIKTSQLSSKELPTSPFMIRRMFRTRVQDLWDESRTVERRECNLWGSNNICISNKWLNSVNVCN